MLRRPARAVAAALAFGWLALGALAHGHAFAHDAGAAAKRARAHAVAPALSGASAAMAQWISASGDNFHRPFVVIDKLGADIFVFDAAGKLKGSAPALVGLARGDDSADGVGSRGLSHINPDERTTPAGRFVARFGTASGPHRKVLWVDYYNAISLHPVVTTNPKEHRLRRIRSAAPADHRISFGCINVPARFYNHVVLKAVSGGSLVVYILPDTKTLKEVFPLFTPVSSASPPPSAAADAATATSSP
jgi:hypothetical protein